MKRKSNLLFLKSVASLTLAIEHFNRPSDLGRCEATLLFTSHSLEMLLKAMVFEWTGKIRKPGDRFNYSFEKCVDLCLDQLNLLSADESIIFKNIGGFRDAAQHDLIFLSEGILFNHVQSAIEIYKRILKVHFKRSLAAYLPARILPISTILPTDIHAILKEDLADAKKLLVGRKRKEDEAEARLRTFQIMEANLQEAHGEGMPIKSLTSIVKQIKKGTEISQLFPMSANLSQNSEGLPVSLHMTKSDGVAVRIDPSAPNAIAFKYIKTEDKYPYLTGELAKKLNVTSSKLQGIVKVLKLKESDLYLISIKISAPGKVSRYSHKALEIISAGIEYHGVDKIWELSKTKQTLDLNEFR